MKALVITKPRVVEYLEVEKPKLRPFDVMIKVSYAGICGTDIDIYNGEIQLAKDGLFHYPVRIGHEWSGIVQEIGPMCKDVKPGDRVISDNWVSCGECAECKIGNYIQCGSKRPLGTCNAWDGAFAEYIRIPYWHLTILPDHVPLDTAAVIEPASIAYNGLLRGGFSPNCNLLVMGTGPIGIAAVGLAKCMGGKKVIIAGRRQQKLDVAKQMGADAAIDISKEDLKTAVMEKTQGKGADIVIEASGAIECVRKAVGITAVYGKIVLVGFYDGDLSKVFPDHLVSDCISIIGVGGQAGLSEVLKFVREGRLDLARLITHRFPFDKAAEVIRDPSRYAGEKLKLLVEMSSYTGEDPA